MKKAIFGLAAIAAVIGLRALVKRKDQKMREHCQQMAAKCKQMMAAQGGDHGEALGMREHCKQMIGQFESGGETREPAESVAV